MTENTQCERCGDGEATAVVSIRANYDGAMKSEFEICEDCVRSLGKWFDAPGGEL